MKDKDIQEILMVLEEILVEALFMIVEIFRIEDRTGIMAITEVGM